MSGEEHSHRFVDGYADLGAGHRERVGRCSCGVVVMGWKSDGPLRLNANVIVASRRFNEAVGGSLAELARRWKP